VIDDEADHASVDTGEQLFDADGKPDDEHRAQGDQQQDPQDPAFVRRKAYVGYTATPVRQHLHPPRKTQPRGGP
jgi:hypothetical protein